MTRTGDTNTLLDNLVVRPQDSDKITIPGSPDLGDDSA